MPGLCLLHVYLQQDEIGVLEPFGKPRSVERTPQLLGLDGSAGQFAAAGDRDIALAADIGIGKIDARVRAYSFHLLSMAVAEKPNYAIAIHVLGRHGAAMQTAIAAEGGQHGKINALDQLI